MGWQDWVREVEIEPSLYAADFARLGEQIEQLLDAGCRIFHFDVGDGHFVPPVTIGPVVLRSIAPLIHDRGGRLDCHLMVDNPVHHFAEMAESGGDSVTFHVETADDAAGVAAAARDLGLGVGLAFNPGTAPEVAAEAVAKAMPTSASACRSCPATPARSSWRTPIGRIAALRGLVDCLVQVDGGVKESNVAQVRAAGADLLVVGSGIFAAPAPAEAYGRLAQLVA